MGERVSYSSGDPQSCPLVIPEEILNRIKRETDLRELITEQSGVQFKGSRTQCVLHGGSGYNLAVRSGPDGDTFRCFSECRRFGDAIQFMEYLRPEWSFRDCVEHLADRLAIEIPAPEDNDELSKEEQALRTALGILKDSIQGELGRTGGLAVIPPNSELLERMRTHGVPDGTLRAIGLSSLPDNSPWLDGGPGAAVIRSGALESLALLDRNAPPIGRYGHESGGFVVHGDPEIRPGGSHRLRELLALESEGLARKPKGWKVCTADPQGLLLMRATNGLPTPGYIFGERGLSEVVRRWGGELIVVPSIPSEKGRRRNRKLVETLEAAGVRVSVSHLTDGIDPEALITEGQHPFDMMVSVARSSGLLERRLAGEQTLRHLSDSAASDTGAIAVLKRSRISELETHIHRAQQEEEARDPEPALRQ